MPFGSRRGVVGIEPTGDLIAFPCNFSQTAPSACFFRQVLADRFGLYSAGVQLVCSDAQVGCSTGSWGSREKGSRGRGWNLSSSAWASRRRMGPRF